MKNSSFTIVKGRVEAAPKQGMFSGAYICEKKGCLVLVVVNPSGRPIIEVHMNAEEREMLAGLLRETKLQ